MMTKANGDLLPVTRFGAPDQKKFCRQETWPRDELVASEPAVLRTGPRGTPIPQRKAFEKRWEFWVALCKYLEVQLKRRNGQLEAAIELRPSSQEHQALKEVSSDFSQRKFSC